MHLTKYAEMEAQCTGIVGALRRAWPDQPGVGVEVRKFFKVEAVVTQAAESRKTVVH